MASLLFQQEQPADLPRVVEEGVPEGVRKECLHKFWLNKMKALKTLSATYLPPREYSMANLIG